MEGYDQDDSEDACWGDVSPLGGRTVALSAACHMLTRDRAVPFYRNTLVSSEVGTI